jgi:hypothetical protein
MSLSLLFRSIAYMAVAGAALVSAGLAAGEWTFGGVSNVAHEMSLEQSRGEALDDTLSALHRRHERKCQALEGLLSGWLTFDEAAHEFRQADLAAKLPTDRKKDAQAVAREVLAAVSMEQQDDPRAVAALPGLRAEYRARYGD